MQDVNHQNDLTMVDILAHWFEFSGYDKDQKSFNLLSSEYEYNRAGKRIEVLLRDYDPTGTLAVIYAKSIFKKNMQSTRMHLWDILENPESLCEFQWAYRDFHSPAVLDAEKQYADMMYGLNSSQI
mgnify:CR=1 FL=1